MDQPPTTASDLVNLLQAESLLPERARGELVELMVRFPRPSELVRHLVQRGWLTPWQANELALGRGRELTLGRYVLLDKLGQGGMGQVFRARHTTLDRLDAVKIIRPDRLNHSDTVRRFLREAKAAARLDHPNLVKVHDAGDEAGRHYLAMEYVPGMDLARVVSRQETLAWPGVCAILHQVALGLHHAHDRGLIHRDLKPSNLLLARETRQVKILDFGLACMAIDTTSAPASALTSEGVILGTPDYMAPEQASGSGVDTRADLYSLGCTAYHLLAGHVPFPGGSPLEKLLRHRTEQPVPLGHLRRDVPTAVLNIIDRLLAKDPSARYQTAADLQQALRPLLRKEAPAASLMEISIADEIVPPVTGSAPPLPDSQLSTPVPIGTPLPTLLSPIKEREKRSGARWIIAAGSAAVVLVVLLSVFWIWPDLFRSDGTNSGSGTTGAEGKTQPTATGDGIKPPSPPAMPGRWEAGQVFQIPAQQLYGVALSPDGRWLAAACGDFTRPESPGEVRLLNLATKEWQTLRSHFYSPRHLVFTPDSRTLISTTGYAGPDKRGKGEVIFWNMLDLRERLPLGEVLTGSIDTLALEPQGKWLVVAGRGPALRVIDVPDGRISDPPHPLREFKNSISCTAISNDGRLVAVGYGDGVVEVYEKSSWNRLAQFFVKPEERAYVMGLGFRPGDTELVTVMSFVPDYARPPVIKVWDLDRKALKYTPLHHGNVYVFASALSPDGRTLATGDQDGLLRIWDVQKQYLLHEAQLQSGPIRGVAFSRDGRMLASCAEGGAVQLWHGR